MLSPSCGENMTTEVEDGSLPFIMRLFKHRRSQTRQQALMHVCGANGPPMILRTAWQYTRQKTKKYSLASRKNELLKCLSYRGADI
jgi:hypothetical protein